MSDQGIAEMETKEGKKVPVTIQGMAWQEKTIGMFGRVAESTAKGEFNQPDRVREREDLCKNIYDLACHGWLQSSAAKLFMDDLRNGVITEDNLRSLHEKLAVDVRGRVGEMTEDEFRNALVQAPELGSGKKFRSNDLSSLSMGERVDVLRVLESACINDSGSVTSSEELHQRLESQYAGGVKIVGEHDILTKFLTSKT